MEVETRSYPNFNNLNSKPPFSHSINIDADSSEFHSPEFLAPESSADEASTSDEFELSLAAVNSDAVSPAACDRKYESVDGAPVSVRDGESPAPDREECVDSVSAAVPAIPADTPASAAMKVQKVYRSYRTRRMLADSAVVAEELWWQAIDYARLNHSTISFFNFFNPEAAASRWNRVSWNASKVGKGLSKDAKAQLLAFQHWIEAIDPRHRYGHSLHLYYEEWCKTHAGQPFFYWLDIGDGKEVDLKECPRSKLRQQCIKYLGPLEREHYEYVVVEGKLVHSQMGNLLDTNKGLPKAKWIFVMSTSKKLYAGEKKKGAFHHSSFLAGGASLAAGRLEVEDGTLKSISAYSGHYRPTDDCLHSFLSFLRENGLDLDEDKICNINEDYENNDLSKSNRDMNLAELSTNSEPQLTTSKEEEKDSSSEPPETTDTETETETETKTKYERTLSGGLQSPRAEVPKKAILERINSKKAAKSYQLGRQVSLKWSTGAGPRIGCVADYPVQLRVQALEFVNLSPRTPTTPSSSWRVSGPASPETCPANIVCNAD